MFLSADILKPLRSKSRPKCERQELHDSPPITSMYSQGLPILDTTRPLSTSSYSRHQLDSDAVWYTGVSNSTPSNPAPQVSKRSASPQSPISQFDVDITLFSGFEPQPELMPTSEGDKAAQPRKPLPPTVSALRLWKRRLHRRHDHERPLAPPIIREPEPEPKPEPRPEPEPERAASPQHHRLEVPAHHISGPMQVPAFSSSLVADLDADADNGVETEHEPRQMTAWEKIGERRERERAANRRSGTTGSGAAGARLSASRVVDASDAWWA